MTSINNFGAFRLNLSLQKQLLNQVETEFSEEEEDKAQSEAESTTDVSPTDINGNAILSDFIKQLEIVNATNSSDKNSKTQTSKTQKSEVQTSEAASGNFDFSVVTGFNDNFSDFYTQVSIGDLGSATSKKTIDEGYWDKALDALDQLRPQLHEYIKAQLEAKDIEYNKETVDKFIDYFISKSVEMAISMSGFPLVQTADNWEDCGKSSNGSTFKMSVVVSALLSMIDGELGIGSKYTAFGFKQTPHSAPQAFSEESWNETFDLNRHKVQDTADKFLNSDEKMLKTVLVGLEMPDDGAFGETTTSTKYTVQHVLELYQDTVKGYLKTTYSDLNDEQINDILSKAMTEIMKDVDSMKIGTGMNKGKYNLEQIVQNYGAVCEEILKSEYPESATNHHEGYTFGVNNSSYEEAATQEIKKRLGTEDKNVINTILNVTASYGDKIKFSDFGTILDKVIELFGEDDSLAYRLSMTTLTRNKTTNETLLEEDLRKLIDEFIDGKEYRAGLLFGIGGAMAATHARTTTESKIKEKFPNISNEDMSTIITTLAEYGNKLSLEDLDEILNKISDLAPNGKIDSKFDIINIVDKYLENKPSAKDTPQISETEIEQLIQDLEDTQYFFS